MQAPETLPSKHEDELPVPTSWRGTLKAIADRLAEGDYCLTLRPANVGPVSEALADIIRYQVEGYGDELVHLMDESWVRAVYVWTNGHWEVLVDLCTKDQGVSDLVLFVKVYEQGGDFIFEVSSVHVP